LSDWQEETEEEEESIITRIGKRFFSPKKPKKKQQKTEWEEPEEKVETTEKEDVWEAEEKPLRRAKVKKFKPDLNRSTIGPMWLKRVVALLLLLLFVYLAFMVMRVQPISAGVYLVLVFILMDYLSITRGGQSDWDE